MKRSLLELASLTGSTLEGDPDYLISGVEELEAADSQQVSFLANPRYFLKMQRSQAGAVCLHPSMPRTEGRNFLLHEDPSKAFQLLVELFCTEALSGFEGIHPTAVVHETAELGEGVVLGPHVVIDRGARIGAHTSIGAGSFIGAEVCIGRECRIYPRVTVREGCLLGERVVLQPGVVVGSCGFGYVTDSQGIHRSLKQLGRVVIEDDVEIGANTCIDRARFKTTRIGRGTKIDNLVQIAHSVSVGEDNLIVSQVGIAGSSKTGRNVVLAGQSAVVGHITLDDGVILAGRAAASKSLRKGAYGGAPAVPMEDFNRQVGFLRHLKRHLARLKALEAKVFGDNPAPLLEESEES